MINDLTEPDSHLDDPVPAGYIEVDGDLMAYWTPDGRALEEVWETQEESDDDIPF